MKKRMQEGHLDRARAVRTQWQGLLDPSPYHLQAHFRQVFILGPARAPDLFLLQ